MAPSSSPHSLPRPPVWSWPGCVQFSPPGPASPLGLCTCYTRLGHPSPLLLGHSSPSHYYSYEGYESVTEQGQGPWGPRTQACGQQVPSRQVLTLTMGRQQPRPERPPWAGQCAEQSSPSPGPWLHCRLPGVQVRVRGRAGIQTAPRPVYTD